MFIPVGDDCPRYRTPYVTYTLIALNILAYGYTFQLDEVEQLFFFMNHGSLGSSYNPIRSLQGGFLHAGILHLVGNMWFLFLFGSSVEGKLGHGWMTGLYAACLFLSDLAQYLFAPNPFLVAIGASGAIGGLIGAYWFLFSRTEVEFFYWIGWFWHGKVWLKVHWAVAYLFGWDLLMWFIESRMHVNGGVANSAHLGGFACGFVSGLLIRRFSHVILDGDDIYTRVMVWWLKSKAKSSTPAPMSAMPRSPVPQSPPPGPDPFFREYADPQSPPKSSTPVELPLD